MATKKTKQETSKLQELFDVCPYVNVSKFENDNFNIQTGSAYPRFVIETVNRIRKINSELENETKTFEKNYLQEERTKLTELLEAEDITKLVSATSNWQEFERDYWINLLGKTAAIEILTKGTASTETMTKMVKLPEDDYIKATQICVRLANAIKEATMNAEAAIGINHEEEPATTGPKKLALNKVK
jgi:hypothetical protein